MVLLGTPQVTIQSTFGNSPGDGIEACLVGGFDGLGVGGVDLGHLAGVLGLGGADVAGQVLPADVGAPPGEHKGAEDEDGGQCR